MEHEQHILESGQVLNTHIRTNCLGDWCAIHTQMPGPWSTWPRLWREDRGIMERRCPHGVGHPVAEMHEHAVAHGQEWVLTHGCDGCPCSPNRLGAVEQVMAEQGEWYLLPKDQAQALQGQAEDLLIDVGLLFNTFVDEPDALRRVIDFLADLRTFTDDLRTASTKEK